MKKPIIALLIIVVCFMGCEYIDNQDSDSDYKVLYMFYGTATSTDISFRDNTGNTIYINSQSLPYQSQIYTFGSSCSRAIATIDNLTGSGTVKASIIINNKQFYTGESETSVYIWGYCNPFECGK
jgi:uncharacterized lipoprotein NlpE involved in copper resistance